MGVVNTTRNAVGCQLVADVLQLSGKVRIRATGSSMLPCVLPGDVLVVQREPLRQLAPGDIALFTRDERLFAHRVLQRESGAIPHLITTGDSISDCDRPVLSDELLGRVTSIIRGRRRIHPRATLLDRSASVLFRRSDLLTRCLLWLLCRTRFLREATECLTQ
jgi:hypothetical protein